MLVLTHLRAPIKTDGKKKPNNANNCYHYGGNFHRASSPNLHRPAFLSSRRGVFRDLRQRGKKVPGRGRWLFLGFSPGRVPARAFALRHGKICTFLPLDFSFSNRREPARRFSLAPTLWPCWLFFFFPSFARQSAYIFLRSCLAARTRNQNSGFYRV